MITVLANMFSLDQISESGQCFRLKKKENGRYSLVAYGRYVELSQKDNILRLYCPRADYHGIWEKYFDIRVNYGTYISWVDKSDSFLYPAAQYGYGIRILKQELWESLISFIISQQNSIQKIKSSVELLCKKYGEKKLNPKKEVFYTFPDAHTLANLSIEDLESCNLGYRSKYILRTAQMVANNEVNLEEIKKMGYEEAREVLQKFCGVGSKIAEYICLFALHHMEAFPVDSHIRHIMDKHYANGFPIAQYREFGGVIQQYMFYYSLKGNS